MEKINFKKKFEKMGKVLRGKNDFKNRLFFFKSRNIMRFPIFFNKKLKKLLFSEKSK